MSFFDPRSAFNVPGRVVRAAPLPLGRASSSPSKTQLQRWADRLSDQIDNLEHANADALVIRSLADLLQDIEQAARVAG